MNKRFFNQQNLTRRLRMLFVLFAMLLLPLGAWAEDYPITVAGIQVTSDNATDIVGDGITEGKVTFTSASGDNPATLTLNGATINGDITYSGTEDLTIAFSGTNAVSTSENYAIQYVGSDSELPNLAFSLTNGSTIGSLNISSDNRVIVGFSDVDFGNLNLASASGLGVYYDSSYQQIEGYGYSPTDLTITTDKYYPIWIYDRSLGEQASHTQLNSNKLSVAFGEGTVSFDGNHTITMNNVNFNYEDNTLIVVGPGMEELTVNLVGTSTVISGSIFLSLWATTPLTFTTDESNPGSLTAPTIVSWNNFENGQITYQNGLKVFYDVDAPRKEIISTTGTYIKIGDTPITGTTTTAGGYEGVSFDASTNTLTLNNATITVNGKDAIVSQLDNLTVFLVGDQNTITCQGGDDCAFKGTGSKTVTFATNSSEAGSLQVQVNKEAQLYSNITPIYSGLSIKNEGYTYTISSDSYDLWIGDTRVTDANKDHILGEGNETVTFSVTGTAAVINTLTLNGATLTVPIKVGLSNLTIDIQGTNSITTDETCIQNTAASFVPSLTFKSTSTPVGSLILTKDGDSFITNIGQNNISVSKELAVLMTVYGTEDYSSNLNYITDGSTTVAKFVPSYGVQVNDMQVYAGNYTNVLKNGKVSFDKSTNTLTLDNANGIEGISTTLSTLNIDLVGSNSLYRSSNGSLFESASGDAVTINLKSTGATGALTMETPANFGATLIGENVTLIPVDPIEELSRDVAENKGTLVYGVDYGLTVADVPVRSVNASNVLGSSETATVVFTPANNTASPATPATLTLNGAGNLGTILSGLENLRVVINGENAAVQVSSPDVSRNITFAGGTNGGSLTITAGNDESAVSGFASVSYDGAYAAADVPFGYDKTASQQGYRKSHLSGDNSYLNALTITTVPHYPIWLYTSVLESTQINNTNKNTLLGASGDVSFDGNHTLSLKNSVNCSTRIVSGLSELTISIDGDCIIESPDSGSVVRSINANAPLTIEKASGASSASLKLAAVSYTAVKAFASLDYTGLILLSNGATYSSGALNDSGGNPLNVAIFTSSLKKPTLQMNYETDTYSFQNPNGGGTLKYSRYFANNEGTDEENQVDNGNTFQIFKNGRQYNDPYTVYFEVWVEANGNSSDKLYACRLDVKDMAATYGGTVPAPEFLPKAIEGVTVSGYSLGTRTAVAATVTEGNITLTGAGRQELDAIFSLPDGVEYIKTSTTETPQASFYLDVKPEKPTLSKAAGTYAGTQTITVTNLTPNATAWYYTYEGEEPASPNAQAFPEGGVDISSSKTLAVYYRAEYETETSMEYLYSETTKVAYTILADPELKYMQGATAVTTAEWTLGKDDNTALPVLQNTHSVAVTYESSNTDVATVATDGTVTAVGIGTATITATSAATSEYASGEASYTLTVKRQLDVSFSTSNEWATYCGTENLAMPEGLKAYQVTAVDGSTVTIGEIGYIPANTAVLLKNVSNNNTWSNIAASAYTGATSTFASNKLIGTAEAVNVSDISGGTVYVLYNNMFKRASGGTIPANRGYLVVEPSAVNAGNAPQLSITIGDENTTAISNTDFTDNTDKAGEWYSIDGVKLNGQPQKPGLYIKNGKKVFINKK